MQTAEPIRTTEGDLRYDAGTDTWELAPQGEAPRRVGTAVALRLLAAAAALVPSMAFASYSSPPPVSE